MHIRRTIGMAAKRGGVSVAVGLLLLGSFLPGGGRAAAAATPRSAGTQTSALQLVQQYLSAIGPAGKKLSTVETALKGLGPSATSAQVRAAVAPLGPALAPVEALLNSVPPTTLGALGQPGGTLSHGSAYRTIGEGARLDVGGVLYPNGFQVDVGDVANLTWPTHDRYTSLSAQIGEDDLGKPYRGKATIRFYNASFNTLIPFFVRGKLVFSANIPTTGFLSFSVPLAHLSLVQLSFSAGGYNVVDVINDLLS